MQLPESHPLPIQHLAGVFKSSRITNSYKFYWFLSILQILKSKPSNVIDIQKIAVLMIANVWYPINYYRLSFGKQDQLANVVATLKTILNIPSNTKQQDLVPLIQAQLSEREVEKVVKSVLTYVPYRFLTPWFVNELKGKKDRLKNGLIADFAQKHFHAEKPSLYRFFKQKEIEIQPLWLAYLQQHIAILEGFCLWHLVKYLQKNNPNIPNIADKLFEPKQRNLTTARKFWKNYLQEKPQTSCIYSAQTLDKSFSVDHFLPWSFVTHDQLWNLTPTPKSVNSSKSDNLPNLEAYFDDFSKLQFHAFQLNYEKKRISLLEDYTILFQENTDQIARFSQSTFQTKLQQHISPMIQIAANLGFPSNWVYKPL